MVSLVIILFLVAVLVSLFFGRIAEILVRKMRDRANERRGEGGPVTAAHHVVSRKVG